uniref:AsIV-cont00096-ORF1 n=1 Tax=Apophua simplicipes ichnovirus TaxID=1329648 RepID=S5DYX9_9VIRU|nr:AsIV-cont00096-ORF1 [Apophua simplicipes ichnovirus]
MWYTYRPIGTSYNVHQQVLPMMKQPFIVKPIPDYGKEDEFFDELLEQRVNVIVMLGKIVSDDANEPDRLNRYWAPSMKFSKDNGKYEVTTNSILNERTYTSTFVTIRCHKSTKMCHSFKVFHYHSWNGNGVPRNVQNFNDFIGYTRFANVVVHGSSLPLRPIIVHSDGVTGRVNLHGVIEIGMDLLWFTHRGIDVRCLVDRNLDKSTSTHHIITEQFKFIQQALVSYGEILA